ncbi:MAG: hypothetical protein ACK42Y_07460 [Candidatus Thermochlorobacter sp.]
MSQIGISIEHTSIYLVHVNRGEGGWHHVQASSELTFNVDLYSDLLDKGHPKLVSEVTQKLTQVLSRLAPKKLAVCLNMTGAKCLPIQVEKNIPAEVFEEVCQAEAALFLNEPEDYIWQPVAVGNAFHGKFERYVLIFLPKRYLTRLKMLLLPSQKEINLIDVGHIALHHLQVHPNMRTALLEIEPDYVAFSSLLMPNLETITYTPLEVETDVAYFALSAIQTLSASCPISVIGSAVSDEVISLIADAAKVPVARATLPKNFVVSSQVDSPEKYLKAIGCAVKAMSLG